MLFALQLYINTQHIRTCVHRFTTQKYTCTQLPTNYHTPRIIIKLACIKWSLHHWSACVSSSVTTLQDHETDHAYHEWLIDHCSQLPSFKPRLVYIEWYTISPKSTKLSKWKRTKSIIYKNWHFCNTICIYYGPIGLKQFWKYNRSRIFIPKTQSSRQGSRDVQTERWSELRSVVLLSTSCVSDDMSASRCDMSACIIHTHTYNVTEKQEQPLKL